MKHFGDTNKIIKIKFEAITLNGIFSRHYASLNNVFGVCQSIKLIFMLVSCLQKTFVNRELIERYYTL